MPQRVFLILASAAALAAAFLFVVNQSPSSVVQADIGGVSASAPFFHRASP